ncbi:MAG: hypothetical protein ACRETA_03135 [Gammaproteobacteria bacterium]
MRRLKTLILLAAFSVVMFMTLTQVQTFAARGPAYGWHGGHWYHGRYGSRLGWWWIAAGTWYLYPGPVYPYPAYPYPYPYPYANPPVVIQTQPAAPGPAPTQYWYYCAAAKGYYPYVNSCPGGWQKVPATPPPGTPPGQ